MMQAQLHPGRLDAPADEQRRVGKQPWWLLGEAILAVGVFIAALWVFRESARSSAFHPDESHGYIAASRYFEYVFIERDLTRPEWGDSYLTHTQPKLGYYLVGGSLWADGYDLSELNARFYHYDWSQSFRQNRREGRVPDEALLARARAPMVLTAAGAVGALYVLGRIFGGAIAGLSAVMLTLASPRAPDLLVRALNDAPLAFFLLLALLVGVLGWRRGRGGGLSIGWAVAVGMALGLGLGTKLTAVLSLAAVSGWAVLVAGLTAWRYRHSARGTGLWRTWAVGRGWVLAAGVALVVFIVSDPHLYSDPLLHLGHMYEHRAEQMLDQQRAAPSNALHNPVDGLGFVLGGSLMRYTLAGSRGLPLEAVLATVGTAALLVRTWRGWRATGQVPAEGLVLLTVLAYVAGVSASIHMKWDRYLLPTFLLGTLLGGLGVSTIARQFPTIGSTLKRCRGVARGIEPRP